MTERAQRPKAARTRPERNPQDVLRGLGMRGSAEERDTGGGDPITESVRAGYRIVEQYLEQSRSAAAGMAPRSTSAANVLGDLTSRMVRTTADLFEVWFQMLDATGATRPQAAQAAPGQAPAPPANGHVFAGASVQVRVDSSRPASVAVDLGPRAIGAALAAHDLRSEDETLPRIRGVVVEPCADGAAFSVVVAIPDDQPDGTYNGMIVDSATSSPVGTISVRVAGGSRSA